MNRNITRQRIRQLISVYTRASTIKTGEHFTTVNELSDQLPAMQPNTLHAAIRSLLELGDVHGNKILTEDDKGGILAGIFAYINAMPIAMARWYAYEIPEQYGSVIVPIKMEYATGRLRVNGITPGDRLTIIDDTLSTGGTAISLIEAAKLRKAEVIEMRVVTEKIGFGGRARLEAAGISVRSVLGIAIDDSGHISIKEVFGSPYVPEEWV
jgi:adenine phosphoribosyltransferase